MWQAHNPVHDVDKHQHLSGSLSSYTVVLIDTSDLSRHKWSLPGRITLWYRGCANGYVELEWENHDFLSMLLLDVQLSRNMLPARDSNIAGSHRKWKIQTEGNTESKNWCCPQGFHCVTLPTGQWGLGTVTLSYRTRRCSTWSLPVKRLFWSEFSWNNLLVY